MMTVEELQSNPNNWRTSVHYLLNKRSSAPSVSPNVHVQALGSSSWLCFLGAEIIQTNYTKEKKKKKAGKNLYSKSESLFIVYALEIIHVRVITFKQLRTNYEVTVAPAPLNICPTLVMEVAIHPEMFKIITQQVYTEQLSVFNLVM